ncbi:MAG: hypothetical protein IKY58_02740 [Paludibacteraceae bacterium]|nr:hypothetical protein [Paludibacteraceae bacterium]
MRHFLCFFVIQFSSFFALLAQENYLGCSTILLHDKEYTLCWSARKSDGRIFEEFCVGGESMSKFSSKLVMECVTPGKGIEEEINKLLVKLAYQKEENIVHSFNQVELDSIGESHVEYVQSNVQGGRPFVVEWNYCRFKKLGDRVLMMQIKRRVYKEELSKFLKLVERNRENWIKEFLRYDLNEIKINK